jgi:hypothetical protein
MSVEGLHASFEKIDGKIRALVQKGAANKELAACIRRSWAHHFQRPVSEAAIQGLVVHYRAIYPSSKKTRKNKSQRGGQTGGMAPLDYQVGQGLTTDPYGIFPSEMGRVAVSALDNERFFESPVGRHCNTTGGYAAPGQAGGFDGSDGFDDVDGFDSFDGFDMSGNTVQGGKRRSRSQSRKNQKSQKSQKSQRGGSMWDALVNGHAMGSVPRNVLETGVSVAQGAPIMNPNPDPVHQTWSAAQNPLTAFDTTQIHQYSTLAPVYTGY